MRGAARRESLRLVEPDDGNIVECSLDAGDIPWWRLAKSTLASGLPTRVAPALMEPVGRNIVEHSLHAGGIPRCSLVKRALANAL
jgi:hypothetical protein